MNAPPAVHRKDAKPLLPLSTFDWSGFVASHFSLALAGGTIALPNDRSGIDRAFIQGAVLEKARDSFAGDRAWPFPRREPDDLRWEQLVTSMEQLPVMDH